MNNFWTKDLENSIRSYLENLERTENFTYNPAIDGLTENGNNLSLGFICFALKIKYMIGDWQKLDIIQQNTWIDKINSYQKESKVFPANSYIDDFLLKSYQSFELKKKFSDVSKSIINLLPMYEFETSKQKLLKAVNADTKQAVATIFQAGYKNEKKIDIQISNQESLDSFLNQYDWAKPWNAGAQFSSLCVYNETQDLNIRKFLIRYISKKADSETGSYFSSYPKSTREIINGAMKVITGLDWLGHEIHYPKKMIDFCIENEPVMEGCDLVDYVYVLFKCSQQVEYRKKEINTIFLKQLNYLEKLYVKDEGGFSYFTDGSQTHYYGVQITNGKKQADIHGTTLCTWAIAMIAANVQDENFNLNWNLIKP